MNRTLSFTGREVFWPPADELIEAAERIRAHLGEWPRAAAPWRLCLTPPDEPRMGDLIVVADEREHDAARPAWLAAGAGVLEATHTGVRLTLGGKRTALVGEPADDWLAALASFLDCGFDPADALVLALAWRDADESRGDDAWPCTLAHYPRIADLPAAPARPFAACPPRLGLYPVVPSAQWVERLVALGVGTIQLRLKDAPPARLADEIGRSVEAGRRHGARVFINDHWCEALEAGAYGVHLGQEDLDTADLSAIAAAGLRLGLSTHGYSEMLRAAHYRPSYLAFGAVFPTGTKMVPTAPQGLARLARFVRLFDGAFPLVAIGGITLESLPGVLATGVGSAAVVSAVTAAADPAAAVAALEAAFAAAPVQRR
ncbi:thiamine phosphate synthase [Trinickia caryophylli]|uniref:Thiamine-phosphate synthase n=1 Tax=Trinickia caryophylli TaxID=28094 RepID=A0A1X7F5G2_TRICW|nr:thiamine phosphate synthase [Trinickia caryophylli]PMS10440.1 thiamine phosphate synthase [Trinickia caryophylli]TRX19441.1 thiamine phosphate synthase [Trinickia caryophylli]WQE13253.1 thiamine phosphate synthase [Trinickia caryophylli]SMF45656.1 thiamine-phosphate diphosphorylase [Trinickia caryophylli]GLU34431.1 thiamine phosphate synthase [Trinickia caryophylli]